MRLTLAPLAAAALAALALSHPAVAKDGVYTTVTQGRNGGIDLEVTVKGDRIADIKVREWSETHPVADRVVSQMVPEIIRHQSLAVDAASGATLSSFALKNGVRACLAQAGLDPKDFQGAVPKAARHSDTVTVDADVVVVGAGGAGLSAAVAAAEAGKKVVLLEKNGFAGGNTSVCGGCFNSAGPNQAEIRMTDGLRKIVEGFLAEKPRGALHGELLAKVAEQWKAYNASGKTALFDSPEFHALQTWKSGDYRAELPLVYTLTRNTGAMMKELERIGFVWRAKANQSVGALWPRSNRAENYRSGYGYIDTFLAHIQAKGLPVEIRLSTRAQKLLVRDGRVVGVKAQGEDGRGYVIHATGGVVLATGGFGANPEMRNRYDELWGKKLGKGTPTTNLPSATGDGVVMAEKAGAALTQMGLIQLFPGTDPQTGAMSYSPGGHALYVNRDGKRYVNEAERRDVLAKAALAQPGGVFYVITSAKGALIDKEGRNVYGVKVEDILRMKKSFRADTIEEAARLAGINVANTVESVRGWNAFCRREVASDVTGRPSCLHDHRLDEGGPFYITPMAPSVHHTMGGVRINTRAQALNADGNVIPGLFAAGEVTGGIHGTNRVGCNAVPDALVYGRIAGTNAAAGR